MKGFKVDVLKKSGYTVIKYPLGVSGVGCGESNDSMFSKGTLLLLFFVS